MPENWISVSEVRACLCNVLPLELYEKISTAEILLKLTEKVNEVIKDIQMLPDFIEQLIREYITSDAIEKVIEGLFSEYILNPKYPPTGIPAAKGDGTADDTLSLQGCIDYANANGLAMLLTSGKYLTGTLTVKPNMSIVGIDKYTTFLILKGGETGAVINGTVTNFNMSGLTIDARMGVQVNNCDCISVSAGLATFKDLVLTGGYDGFNLEKTANIELENITIMNAVNSMLSVGGTGALVANNLTFGALSATSTEAIIMTDASNDVYTNITAPSNASKLIVVDGNGNTFSGNVPNALNRIEDNGTNNTFLFAPNYYKIAAQDINLAPVNPLTYKTPSAYNKYFDKVDFKDGSKSYQVLVANAFTSDLDSSLVSVKQYGAVGDGITDDSQAFLDAIASEHTIFIPDGNYKLTQRLIFTEPCLIVSSSNAVLLSQIPNGTTGCIKINASNSTFINLNIQGLNGTTGETGTEFNHGIYLGDADNVTLLSCRVSNMFGDGFYIGRSDGPTGSHNAILNGCIADTCARNGFSIIDHENFHLVDCAALNIKGTNPQVGIDVEPNQSGQNPSGSIENFYASECYMGCFKMSIYFSGCNADLVIDGLTSVNCCRAGTVPAGDIYFADRMHNSGNVILKNVVQRNCRGYGLCVEGFYAREPISVKNYTSFNHLSEGFLKLITRGTAESNTEGYYSIETNVISPSSVFKTYCRVQNTTSYPLTNVIVRNVSYYNISNNDVPANNQVLFDVDSYNSDLYLNIAANGTVTYSNWNGVTCSVSNGVYTINLPDKFASIYKPQNRLAFVTGVGAADVGYGSVSNVGTTTVVRFFKSGAVAPTGFYLHLHGFYASGNYMLNPYRTKELTLVTNN